MPSLTCLQISIVILSLLQNHLALAATCTSKAAEDIVIALDVGHVAKQPGMRCERLSQSPCPWGETSARGFPEYDFNLKLARRIKKELAGAGFTSTNLMITRTQGDVGLHERAIHANRMNADIFLSIHHDGVRDEYLKPWTYQGEQHFYFDESKGFSLHVSPQNGDYRESVGFARMLADQFIEGGLHFTTVHQRGNPVGAGAPFVDSKRGIYQRDRLVVLSDTEMPAVLLEAGVIVNRDEELAIDAPAYKAVIATAVVEAVRQFCKIRDAAT